jgi:RimJ/RimL family protein N-acetyltransferase
MRSDFPAIVYLQEMKNIVIYRLPEGEASILKQNIAGDELVLSEWEGTFTEPGESLAVSGDMDFLKTAHEAGLATVCLIAGTPKVGDCATPSTPTRADVVTSTSDLAAAFTPDIYAEGLDEADFTFFDRVYRRHHGMPWTIAVTERCIIKEFSMDYLDELFALYDEPGMTDHMEGLYPYEEEAAYQQAYIDNMYHFYGFGMWIVCDRERGRLIGRAGLEYREDLNGEIELGYAISARYRRQGYATEVCRAIMRYAADELDFDSLCCLIEPGNDVSIQFAKKLGFSYDKTLVLGGKKYQKYCIFGINKI